MAECKWRWSEGIYNFEDVNAKSRLILVGNLLVASVGTFVSTVQNRSTHLLAAAVCFVPVTNGWDCETRLLVNVIGIV